MAKSGRTSPSVATQASHVLNNPNASAVQRSLAGSALAQSGTAKRTSPEMASTAAKALDSPKSSTQTRDLAGSVLEQRRK
jgi:hypothetical protein